MFNKSFNRVTVTTKTQKDDHFESIFSITLNILTTDQKTAVAFMDNA